MRDCTHPKARHEHGTVTGYVRDRCRCQPCRDAATEYERHRHRQQVYGRWVGLVDADPVRAHIRLLSEAGIGLKQITRLTGVSGGVLTKLVYGHPNGDGTRRPPSRRCTPRVRDRIMAIPADVAAAAGGIRVDGAGTRRRLEALMCLGWSQSKLAYRLEMAPANFGKVLRGDQVVKATATATIRLYEQLWDQPAPETTHRDRIAASRARRASRERGYAPPLAWDDDTIDDPGATPDLGVESDELDEIAVQRFMAGTLRAAAMSRSPERLEAIRRLNLMGFSDSKIGDRVGMKRDAVTNVRLRHRKEVA